MNIKTASAIAALLLVVGVQNAEAKNPVKGGGGSGGGSTTSRVNFGAFSTTCYDPNSQATASFQNVPGVGETVQLTTKRRGLAVTNLEGLDTVNYTMLGGINFTVTGSSINNNNFVAIVFFTAAGDNVVTQRNCWLSDGGIQQGNSSTSYFIGVNHRNGNTQIPAGSRINGIQFYNLGNTTGTRSNNISNLTFTAFPGAGYDLTSPAAFCN